MAVHMHRCRFMMVLTLGGVAVLLIAAPVSFLHALEAKESAKTMICIPATKLIVGSTPEERAELGRQYGFHPSWLADELPAQEVTLKEFWIDRFPVTNRQYAAYLRATGHPAPVGWNPAFLDHPVVNMSGQEAATYAEWVGKRLPTPQEWECAFQGVVAKPVPIRASLDWLTQTRPVSDGAVAPSGVRGYGLVSEQTTAAHLGDGQFLLKGPSWLHEEAWSFRPQTSHWTGGGGFSYIGFRCAADSEVADRPELSEPLPQEWLTPVSGQPAPPSTAEHVSIEKFGERYFTLQFGRPRGICHLFCPEVVSVDGKTDVFVYTTSPAITWHEGENEESSRRIAFSVRGDFIRTKYVLEAGRDWVDVEYLLPNEGDKAQQLSVSICANPYSTFSLYDVELNRTYFWFGEGDWVRARRLSRGPGGRSLTGHAPPSIPEAPRLAAAAVLSRDGSTVFGYAKEILGRNYSVADHANINCFHIDPTVELAPGETYTVRGRVYYMEGGLDALRRRIEEDFAP